MNCVDGLSSLLINHYLIIIKRNEVIAFIRTAPVV